MKAQTKWKKIYFFSVLAKKYGTDLDDDWRMDMWQCRREAALERKLEAAQRKIDEQAQRIEELEQDVEAFEQERNDMEAHVALTEFARTEFGT